MTKTNDNQQEFKYPVKNPLEIFDNPKATEILRRIRIRRISGHIFEDYYKLGESPKYIWHDGNKYYTHSELIDEELRLLKQFRNMPLNEVPFLVMGHFHNNKLGEELFQGFLEYGSRIKNRKVYEVDLLMVKDLLNSSKSVVDLGCGLNLLGKAIIEYSDKNNLSLENVTGVDYNDWSEKVDENRLKYVKQVSASEIPLENETADTVIVKWALHHMDLETLGEQLKSIYRILKPNGKLIVIEPLRTEDPQVIKKVKEAQRNPELWPSGIWFEESDLLTKDYLHLTPEEQRLVLIAEDWIGHVVYHKRLWMPFPCDYLSVEDYHKMITSIGFKHTQELDVYFGLMPIIKQGPPSVRLVFQK